MAYSKDFEVRIDKLMEQRGISGHTAADRFISDFKAYLCYYDTVTSGSASSVMRLFEQGNLVSNDIFRSNFRYTYDELLPRQLKDNEIFMLMFKKLMDNKGKGVGAGELVLPLIIKDYYFSNDSDGVLATGEKVEIKKNGASLKPVEKNATLQGIVDTLNEKYFAGTVPGYRLDNKFSEHLKTVQTGEVYREYFKELYPTADPQLLEELGDEVSKVYTDKTLFNTAVGRFALKQYKKVDNWHNILIIDDERELMVNIVDCDHIEELGIVFHPKFKRGGDTQAVADGYVNIGIS